MSVSAIIVTRGDQDLTPVLASLPEEWERIVWDNGAGMVTKYRPSVQEPDAAWEYVDGGESVAALPDLGVYGRYAAIEYATHDVIYVQDDDVIVSDPAAIVDAWHTGPFPCGDCNGNRSALCADCEGAARDTTDHVVCNMPPEFRHDFYEEHALVGFGAVFHREAPGLAFNRWHQSGWPSAHIDLANCCDIIFTGLTPRVLVDVAKEDLPYAHHETRMWKQPGHVAERARVLEKVRSIA